MIFKQSPKDGSADIEFSDAEVEIIKRHKRIHFTPESFRHFGNHLVAIVASFQKHFQPEVRKIISKDNTNAEGTEPKKPESL